MTDAMDRANVLGLFLRVGPVAIIREHANAPSPR
jgi:hypothetical protein